MPSLIGFVLYGYFSFHLLLENIFDHGFFQPDKLRIEIEYYYLGNQEFPARRDGRINPKKV